MRFWHASAQLFSHRKTIDNIDDRQESINTCLACTVNNSMDGCQSAIVGRPHIVVRATRIFRRSLMSAHTILVDCWHKASYCILTTGKNDDTHQQNLNTMWFPRQLYGHIQHNGISPRIKTIVLTPKKDYGRQDYANTCWVCTVSNSTDG